MSYQRGRAGLFLEPTDRIPRFETIYHPGLLHKLTGIDPYREPLRASLEAMRALDMDIYRVGTLPTRASSFQLGETADTASATVNVTSFSGAGASAAATAPQHSGGKTKVAYWGLVDTETQVTFDVGSPDDVYAFDPARADPRTQAELTAEYARQLHEAHSLMGDLAYTTVQFYTTLFMWPVMIFGWENFMLAAAGDPDRFKVVLDGFGELSVRHLTAWADAGAEVIFCHDDLAMTNQLVFRPSWYERYVFPWYRRLWTMLRERGVRIIFNCDGAFDPLVEDLIALGVAGFQVERRFDVGAFLERYGQTHVLVAGVDQRTLTFGTREDVERATRETAEMGRRCPGFIWRADTSIPGNIPLENLETYFACQDRYGQR